MRVFFQKYLDKPCIEKDNPILPWLILAVIILITQTALFASVGVNIATPDIQGYYNLGVTESDWITTAYLMMLATTIPISARVGAQYGFKYTFFLGCSLFFFANLCVCFAPTYELMLLWRFVAGAGSGILMPQSISILAFTFSKKLLPLALSLYTALGFGAGFTFGALLGGLYSQEYPFQGIFFWIFIIGVVSLLGILLFFHETKPKEVSPFDFPGYLAFLGIIFSALLFTMNVKAPWNTQGWYSFYSIMHACVIVASLIGFIYWELTTTHPLFLLKHFAIRPFLLASIAMFFLGGLVFGTPVFFSNVLHTDLMWPNIQVGSHFAVFGIAVGISGALTGIFVSRIGIRWPTVLGLGLVCYSCFINHSFTIYSTHLDLYAILVTRGIGVGMALGPVTSLGLMKIPPNSKIELAKATVMLTILRQMGAAFSSNILGILITERTVYHTERFSEMIRPMDAAYQDVTSSLMQRFTMEYSLPSKIASIHASQEIDNLLQRQAHIAAFNDAFFAAGVVLTCMTCLLVFLMLRKYVLRKLGKSYA